MVYVCVFEIKIELPGADFEFDFIFGAQCAIKFRPNEAQ